MVRRTPETKKASRVIDWPIQRDLACIADCKLLRVRGACKGENTGSAVLFLKINSRTLNSESTVLGSFSSHQKPNL